MPPVYRSASSAVQNVTSATTLVIDTPVETVATDWLIAHIGYHEEGLPSTPAGWTRVQLLTHSGSFSQEKGLAVYARQAGALQISGDVVVMVGATALPDAEVVAANAPMPDVPE